MRGVSQGRDRTAASPAVEGPSIFGGPDLLSGSFEIRPHALKPTSLQVLARLQGVQAGYRDAFGQWRTARPEALHRVLELLGLEASLLEHPERGIQESIASRWRRPVEPVCVLWEDRPVALGVRLRSAEAGRRWEARIDFETGGETRFSGNFDSPGSGAEVEGIGYCEFRLALPEGIPWGYHRLVLTWADQAHEVLLIRTPVRAAGLPGRPGPRTGAFLPLYALRTEHDWGAGDFSDLAEFTRWAGQRNFEAVGILPLLPAFLEQPFDPSPYSPISRRFWGEHFVDPRAAPEFETSAEARQCLENPAFLQAVTDLRERDKVDYARLWKLKRPVLEALSRELRRHPARWRERMDPYIRETPDALEYARFRAAHEKYSGENWRRWPGSERTGSLETAELDPKVVDFYLYAQLLAHEQVSNAAASSQNGQAPLYLDLPLGAHPDGFDHWRDQEDFVEGISVGAPPDPLFTGGQDWGFAPLHPRQIRSRGYRYFITCLRHHLAHAQILRIDHVLGFHRLFWVPAELGAREGVYVQYPAEEFYGILALESRRYGAAIVGEDLGTVPSRVRATMDRHGISRTYAMQIELRSDPAHALGDVPDQAVACVNTHDLPPFAAFWKGDDIEQQAVIGLLDESGKRREHEGRGALRRALLEFLKLRTGLSLDAESPVEILGACLRLLRASRAGLTLVNLEDLWGERRRQNLPGSVDEHPNWQHRARISLEQFDTVRDVEQLLHQIGVRRDSPED